MHLSKASQKLFCCYTNATSRIQIVKIISRQDYFLERTVMPKGTITFEADKEARLEVHTSEMMSAILSDTIPCWQLDHRLIWAEKSSKQQMIALQVA